MKQQVVFILLLSLISFNFYCNSNEEDSTRLVKLFQNALRNPNQSDSLNEEAIQLVNSKSVDVDYLEDIYLYNYSKFLFQTSNLDSALLIAKKGISLYSEFPLAYKASKFYNIVGTVSMFQNKNKIAILEFQKAIKILEKNKDFHQAALVKNNIANMFFTMTDYESSYKYSSEAYAVLKSENDTIYLARFAGMLSISAIKLEKLEEGERLAKECVRQSEVKNDILGLIVGNYSLGELNLANENYEKSSYFFLESLAISDAANQPHYSMLNKIGLLNVFVHSKNYSKALFYGAQALEESQRLNNINTLYSIHKNLGYAYSGLSQYEEAFINLDSAHNIYRDIVNLENQTAINDVLVKYDLEKKEKEIVKNKLTIAQDEIQLNKRKLWIFGLSMLILFLLVSYYFYYRVQRHKFQQLKKEEEQKMMLNLMKGEEKERERISNELHDGVASSITAIKIKLEHINSADPSVHLQKLSNELSVLHEETRRISHNLMPIYLTKTNFLESLENYCKENSTSSLNITFSNLVREQLPLSENKVNTLFRISQELINNVKKHSNSLVCFIQVSVQSNQLIISVEDEGIGFDPLNIKGSQGLHSIKKRLINLGGELTIESKLGNGSLIIISSPL